MKKCWACGGDLEITRDKPYQYKESGLDNVFLHGVIQYKCRKCGEEAPEIPNIEALHLQIGKAIICSKNHLLAQEIVYLRKELGLKGKEMAELLSVTPQEYSKWENAKDIISPAYDKHLRLIYILNADFAMGKVLHNGIRFMKYMSLPKRATHNVTERTIDISVSEWVKPEMPVFSEDCFVAS